jgi:hypothetical protein
MRIPHVVYLSIMLAAAGARVQAAPIIYEVVGTVGDPGAASSLMSEGDPFRFLLTLDPVDAELVTYSPGQNQYQFSGVAAWDLSAGAFTATGSSAFVNVFSDPYFDPNVAQVVVHGPDIHPVFSLMGFGVGATSIQPLTGDFVLPTSDAFYLFDLPLHIWTPSPIGGQEETFVPVSFDSAAIVPEPSTLLLALSGLMALRLRRRR